MRIRIIDDKGIILDHTGTPIAWAAAFNKVAEEWLSGTNSPSILDLRDASRSKCIDVHELVEEDGVWRLPPEARGKYGV